MDAPGIVALASTLRQKSEARQSAQHAQARIEEAVFDKDYGRSDKPPNLESATTQMQPAGGREQKSWSQKTNEKHSSKQPKRKPRKNGMQSVG